MEREQVIEYIEEVKFCHLATVGADNAPHVRPVAMATIYGDDLYFFTFAGTRKVAEIESHPQVEAVWSRLADQTQVRISGTAVVEHDEATIERFKADNPIVARMLPPPMQHLFVLYKLQPDVVHWAGGLVPYTEVAWRAEA